MITQSPILLILPIILGSVIALVFLLLAFRSLWRLRLISDLPTSKTQGVFIGFTEIKGTAECETPLVSYLGETSCVQYEWSIEEHWSRTVTETHRDASGHMQTRTRTESGWKTVDSGKKAIAFYLKDDTGIIRIAPERADIHAATTFYQTFSRDNALYFAKGPEREVPHSNHRRRFKETALPLHASLYVLGQARVREDVVAAEIAYSKKAPMFIISTRTEKQISTSFKRRFLLWLILGIVLLAIGFLVRDLLVHSRVMVLWQPYAIMAAVYLAAFGVGYVWTLYNSFIQLRQRVQRAWSQVDIELKRRNDLIPRLVQCIDAYSIHEREGQMLVTELRGQLAATAPDQAGPDFRGMSGSLLAVLERYPELKAAEQFLKLQTVLVETEQRIALARDYFNETATFYNNRLQIIPDRFIAAIAGMKSRRLMEFSDFERAPVQVNLAG
jgi:hypothetical protein